MKKLFTVAILALANVGGILAVATPADATTAEGSRSYVRFTDPNDRPGFDIRAVKVRYGNRLNIRIVHDGNVAFGQKFKFWVDTRARNVGPEYAVVFYPNTDGLGLFKVNSFSDPGTLVRNSYRMTGAWADVFQPRRDVWAFIGARRLGRPSRVRVSAQLAADGRGDWAPGRRQFSDWASRY